MKTSLAIVLAAVALMFSAILGLIKSHAANAGYDHAYKSAGRCGIVACAYPDQAPKLLRPYRSR
jgi:hypothetical protein